MAGPEAAARRKAYTLLYTMLWLVLKRLLVLVDPTITEWEGGVSHVGTVIAYII